MAGPVDLAKVVENVADNRQTPEMLLLVGLVGANLAIFNLIPFPALDGGRLFFVFIEMARRGKRVPPQLEEAVHFAGFVLLLALVALVTLADVTRFS